MRLLAALLCFALAIPQGAPQLPEDEFRAVTGPYEPKEPPAIRVETNSVLLRVVVRDRAGKVVTGLKRDDFEVRDDGRLQEIKTFIEERGSGEGAKPSNDTSVPAPGAPKAPKTRWVALFFDDLNMKLGELVNARKSAEKWVREGAPGAEQIGVFTSSQSVMQNFTTDQASILAKLGEIRTQARRDGFTNCPRIGAQHAYLISRIGDTDALEAAVQQAFNCPGYDPRFNDRRILSSIIRHQADNMLAIAEQYSQQAMAGIARALQSLARRPGQRILLLTSSGFWTRTLTRQKDRLTDIAVRNEILVNSLDAKGLATNMPDYADGPPVVMPMRLDLQNLTDRYMQESRESMGDILAALSEGTGGHYFHNNNDLDRGVRELAVPQENVYLMGFMPFTPVFDGKFHRLQVKLKQKGRFSVKHRSGYFVPSTEEVRAMTEPTLFDAAMKKGRPQAGIEMDVQEEKKTSLEGDTTLHLTLRISLKSFPFQKNDDRQVQHLRFATAVYSPDGEFLSGRQALFLFSLKEANYERMWREGLEQKLTIYLPRGKYVLRHLLQEAARGKIALINREVTIP